MTTRHTIAAPMLLLFAGATLHGQDDTTPRLVGCEQKSNRIVLLREWPVGQAESNLVWAWDPGKSTGIAPAHKGWFGLLSDAKPVMGLSHVLVCASGGGIALIRIADSRVVFYAAPGGNTHSIELLPDGNLVSASSSGNFLKVFSTDSASGDAPEDRRHSTTTLMDAHGVTWDYARNCLWAVGEKELVRCTYNNRRSDPVLTIEERFPLPGQGHGHDLYPVPGTDALFITGSQVWSFLPKTSSFTTVSELHSVKSVSQHSGTDSILMMQATERWWSDTLVLPFAKRSLRWEGTRFYKARWWIDNAFSYGPASGARLSPTTGAAAR